MGWGIFLVLAVYGYGREEWNFFLWFFVCVESWKNDECSSSRVRLFLCLLE